MTVGCGTWAWLVEPMVSDGGVWGEGDGRRGVGEVVVGRVWGREVVGQGLGDHVGYQVNVGCSPELPCIEHSGGGELGVVMGVVK